jgi:phosphate/sulfate permease
MINAQQITASYVITFLLGMLAALVLVMLNDYLEKDRKEMKI